MGSLITGYRIRPLEETMKRLFAACALLALALPFAATAGGKVTETRLGTGLVDREISGETSAFEAGQRAYFWFRVEDAADEVLTVTWKVNDLAFPVELTVGSSPWRTWASKTLHVAGEWIIVVTNASGATLHESRFAVK